MSMKSASVLLCCLVCAWPAPRTAAAAEASSRAAHPTKPDRRLLDQVLAVGVADRAASPVPPDKRAKP
jgi:hypothetical protein